MPEESRSYELKMVTASENQCKDSLVRGFEVYPLPEITTGADTTVSLGFDVMLAASGGVSYDWIPQTGLDNSKAENPKYTALEDAIFTVTGTDDNGCVNTAIQTITVTNDYSVIPTNVITPDGNGQNDFWIIENIENYKNCEVRIFDRWGNLVYQKKNGIVNQGTIELIGDAQLIQNHTGTSLNSGSGELKIRQQDNERLLWFFIIFMALILLFIIAIVLIKQMKR